MTSSDENEQDKKLECAGKEEEWFWSGNDQSAELYKHNKLGQFFITIEDDCTVATEGDDKVLDSGSGSSSVAGVAASLAAVVALATYACHMRSGS